MRFNEETGKTELRSGSGGPPGETPVKMMVKVVPRQFVLTHKEIMEIIRSAVTVDGKDLPQSVQMRAWDGAQNCYKFSWDEVQLPECL
jgi:hypothetical protein